jgi:hypothetical protein
VGFFSSVEARAGEERWFGHCKAGTVPGYEVLESELLPGDFYGLQHQGRYEEMSPYMKQQCV